jgi:hypothetical protein
MIGMFTGASIGKRRIQKGFVVLHHELLSFLKDFTGSEWLVLTCLSLHADETGYSYPSISLMCEETGLSERIVQQSIKSLSAVTEKRQYVVLQVQERHATSGRRQSNGYSILPDGFDGGGEGAKSDTGEGAKSDTGEGAKNVPPITLKNIHKEEDTPIVPKRGTKRESIKMPVEDDPAKALYLAYRSVVFTDTLIRTAFLLGEWRGAHHVLRSMQAAGVTPAQVEYATHNLVTKWGGRRELVTINALWKHWSTAITNEVKLTLVDKAIDQADRLWKD